MYRYRILNTIYIFLIVILTGAPLCGKTYMHTNTIFSVESSVHRTLPHQDMLYLTYFTSPS